MLTPEDRKQIGIAIVIAAGSAVVAGLINWAIEEAKDAVKKAREPKEE